jgi:outer membrane protein assembly factor BamB
VKRKYFEILLALLSFALLGGGCCSLPLVPWEWPQQEPGAEAEAILEANHARAKIIWTARVATPRLEPEEGQREFIDAGPVIDHQGKFVYVESRGDVVLHNSETGAEVLRLKKPLPSSFSALSRTDRASVVSIDGGQNLSGSWRQYIFIDDQPREISRKKTESIEAVYYADGVFKYSNLFRMGVSVSYTRLGETRPLWQREFSSRLFGREGYYYLENLTAAEGIFYINIKVVNVHNWNKPGTADTLLVALDAATGKIKWECELGDTEEIRALTPLFPLKSMANETLSTMFKISGNTLIVNKVKTEIEGLSDPLTAESFGVDLANGEVVWRHNGLAIVTQGTDHKSYVVIFPRYENLAIIDIADGSEIASAAFEGRLLGSAVDSENGVLVYVKAVEIENRLQTYTEAISIPEATSLWQIVNENPPANPIVGDGFVALGDPFASAFSGRTSEVFSHSVNFADKLDVYNLTDGKLLFRFKLSDNSTRILRAAASGTRLFVRLDDGRLIAVDFEVDRSPGVSAPELDLTDEDLEIDQ